MASCADLLILTYIFSHCSFSTLGIVVCVRSTHTNIVSISEITYVMTMAASGDETQSDLLSQISWPVAKGDVRLKVAFDLANYLPLVTPRHRFCSERIRLIDRRIPPLHHLMLFPTQCRRQSERALKSVPKVELLFSSIWLIPCIGCKGGGKICQSDVYVSRFVVPSRTPALAWLIGWPY